MFQYPAAAAATTTTTFQYPAAAAPPPPPPLPPRGQGYSVLNIKHAIKKLSFHIVLQAAVAMVVVVAAAVLLLLLNFETFEETPYRGGHFYLRIDFTADYPFRPPKIWFQTKVFHPNIDKEGKICIDFLQDEWKPSYSIGYILMAICSLLLEPNLDNPISEEVADMCMNNPEEFRKIAEQWTAEYAS
ncbi:hypothetical protein FSP39_012643 [Pinctada imbricata]|uniref:UBC core domain-containing protein n=1 Tax=Pinctada imbricata TaxID=66713 RepID=A0AA88XY74_PINIB|nr:hypothetical protein FSP39_012643 [Pinctada imbricata]